MDKKVVIDTNVFVSALLNADASPRQVLRLCLLQKVKPLMGNPLYAEYESVIYRDKIFTNSPLSIGDREQFLDDFLNICEWINIYYLWRPNLSDEADNHLIELAVAGGAEHVVTGNTKDFSHASLQFPDVKIITPATFMKE